MTTSHRLCAFTTDAAGQLNVLWHDGDTFSVNGAQVGVFEETDQIGLERERRLGMNIHEMTMDLLHTILEEP